MLAPGAETLSAPAPAAGASVEPAQPAPPAVTVTNSTWNGFQKQSFTLNGVPAYFVLPQVAAPGNPWIWRIAWPDFHAEVDKELLRAGYPEVSNSVQFVLKHAGGPASTSSSKREKD
jgi:hypothetical protein